MCCVLAVKGKEKFHERFVLAIKGQSYKISKVCEEHCYIGTLKKAADIDSNLIASEIRYKIN